jgi:hypothetical protein
VDVDVDVDVDVVVDVEVEVTVAVSVVVVSFGGRLVVAFIGKVAAGVDTLLANVELVESFVAGVSSAVVAAWVVEGPVVIAVPVVVSFISVCGVVEGVLASVVEEFCIAD